MEFPLSRGRLNDFGSVSLKLNTTVPEGERFGTRFVGD